MPAPEVPHVDVLSLRRPRRRLSRRLSVLAVACMLGPIVLALLSRVFVAVGVDGEAVMDFTLIAWLVAWLGGVPLFTAAAALAARKAALASPAALSPSPPRGPAQVVLRAPGGELPLSRLDVEGGLVLAGEPPVVELSLPAGDTLLVEVARRGDGEALLSALGYGPSRRRSVVQLGSGGGALGAGCAGVFLGLVATCVTTCGVAAVASSVSGLDDLVPYGVGAVFVVASVVFARLLSPGRVVIGADGVLVDRAFRRRFVALASVEDVIIRKGTLYLVAHFGGERTEISLSADGGERTQAVRAQLLEAVRGARRASESPEEALARQGRSLSQWRRDLQRLAGGTGYRERSLPVDALLSVAEDHGQSAEQRIGAALVLGLGDDEDAKRRVRVATEALANEPLRAAMVAALEGGEDDALAEALAEAAPTTEGNPS